VTHVIFEFENVTGVIHVTFEFENATGVIHVMFENVFMSTFEDLWFIVKMLQERFMSYL